MSMSTFERYAPYIQKYIYRKKWENLRAVQIESCNAILDTDKHVIIASGTASGKTEAAFFPILTLLEQSPPASIGVMYIGPLKALINDQFERLTELLEENNIPVWPWHGDVSQSKKRKAKKIARGILQITPESLESLIMNHIDDALHLFSDLRFIIIDEIHSLLGEDRGLQVLCLISKLEKYVGCKPRRIGLSATLNNYKSAMEFLSAGSHTDVIAVGLKTNKRRIALCSEVFVLPQDKPEENNVLKKYYEFIYNNCYSKKCLIFTNSRSNAEKTIAQMKNIARMRQNRDIFYVHHGNISAFLRQEAEHALRDNDGPTVAAATLTLELGIDIGDLDTTIQLGAPYTCSSFVQRLGRSGRRTEISQMMFVNLYKNSCENPFEALPWEFLQSIAIIQLYLEEHWLEPFEQKKKPFSLLAHQTLSVLMMHGELSPSELAKNVLLLPPFKNTILTDEYKKLLRYMLNKEYLQRIENGGIIVGLNGEKIANHYSFYAVFCDETVYHVMSNNMDIGTLTNCPAIDETFILAGHSWRVTSIDETHKTIYVVHSSSSKVPFWISSNGVVHTKVVQRMKQILLESEIYQYLQPNAKKLLNDIRQNVAESGLLNYDILPCTEGGFFIAPWVGTKEIRTMSQLLKYGLKEQLKINTVENKDYYLHVTSELDINEFLNKFTNFQFNIENPDIVLPKGVAPKFDKYDSMVPNDLLRLAFLFNQMDVPRAISIFKELTI